MLLYQDNATIHNTKLVEQICRFYDVSMLYTAPYSPAINPVEYLFGSLKRRLRKQAISTE